MAIVKFGPTVVGARGTVAGTIFSANKAGPFVRGWSRGANPATSLQSGQRGSLGTLAASWRDLTAVQKDDWDDYADDAPQELTNSLGETYFASGFNWYVRINLHLEAADEAIRVDAPTLTRPAAPLIRDAGTFFRTTASIFNSKIDMQITSPNLDFNHVVFARVLTAGRQVNAHNFTFMEIDTLTVLDEIIFQPEIESAFGEITTGQRAFYTIQTQDSHGQRSPADTIAKDATT